MEVAIGDILYIYSDNSNFIDSDINGRLHPLKYYRKEAKILYDPTTYGEVAQLDI